MYRLCELAVVQATVSGWREGRSMLQGYIHWPGVIIHEPYLYIPSLGLILISNFIILSFPSGKLMAMLLPRFSSDMSVL